MAVAVDSSVPGGPESQRLIPIENPSTKLPAAASKCSKKIITAIFRKRHRLMLPSNVRSQPRALTGCCKVPRLCARRPELRG